MVTRGRLSIHLQEAPKLSKEWGEGQSGKDDLIGIWPSQSGIWVKYSQTGNWANLAGTAIDIASGDMNGDGREDLVATWDGQGVYYRNSVSGAWVKLATPATLVATGELDGDGKDDLIGSWAKLSSTARHIAAGLMRGGAGAAEVLAEPFGGFAEGPGDFGYQELSEAGPGGLHFLCREEENLIPWRTGSLLCGECLVRANTVSNALNRKTWPQARESKRNAKLRNIGNRSKKYGVL